MITLPGQLAIKTIHGRNGDFNVGRLATSIGDFKVKDAELDQYNEGKYEGEFVIARIYSWSYAISGGMIIETRANLGGMTLSNADRLSKDEAHRLSPQEVDPVDEESQAPRPIPATPAPAVAAAPTHSDPLDDTPFPIPKTAKREHQPSVQDDSALFGDLWPLGEVVKLDPTVNRRALRQQCQRLRDLGYDIEYQSQDWHLKAA